MSIRHLTHWLADLPGAAWTQLRRTDPPATPAQAGTARDLFEFMDQSWVPQSLRLTLRDILETSLNQPFRGYYEWLSAGVRERVAAEGVDTVVELGAGTAPVCAHLASGAMPAGVTLVPSDLNPDTARYDELARRHPGVVRPRYEPIDCSRPFDVGERALVVLSAVFHHIPAARRRDAVRALAAHRVMVFEPLRRDLVSLLVVVAGIVPALATPARLIGRPGWLRRVLWCWLIPVAPAMLIWDGIASSLRCWSRSRWRAELAAALPAERVPTIRRSGLSLLVSW